MCPIFFFLITALKLNLFFSKELLNALFRLFPKENLNTWWQFLDLLRLQGTGRSLRRVQISWLWHFIHYLSIPLCTNSCSKNFVQLYCITKFIKSYKQSVFLKMVTSATCELDRNRYIVFIQSFIHYTEGTVSMKPAVG